MGSILEEFDCHISGFRTLGKDRWEDEKKELEIKVFWHTRCLT
jgi:hypothetical protein